LRRPPISTLFPYTTLCRSLDESWNTVGGLSLAGFERPKSRYRPPTAHRMGESEIWFPELFRLVAQKLADDDSLPLEIAITSYLRSEEHTSELQSRENLVCR